MDPVVQRNIDDWVLQKRGLADDWTHHYLVFSNPGTEQQAIETGNYEQWLKIVNDPRFTLQQIKTQRGRKGAAEGTGLSRRQRANAEVSEAGAPESGTGYRGNGFAEETFERPSEERLERGDRRGCGERDRHCHHQQRERHFNSDR